MENWGATRPCVRESPPRGEQEPQACGQGGEDEEGGEVALSIRRQATHRSRQGGWQAHGIPVKVEVHPGAYHLAAAAGTDM